MFSLSSLVLRTSGDVSKCLSRAGGYVFMFSFGFFVGKSKGDSSN